ncbi:kinase-like protein, partial [Stipitochalara longipes BDJ]
MDNLSNGPRAHWRGIKFLGEGISSRVGLWEYTDPDPNAPVPGGVRQIAVKELKTSLPDPQSFDLAREAAILTKLRQSGSPHIAHLVHNPGPVTPDERLPPGRFDNVVRRIFLQYCSLGSLNDLLDRRIRLAIPFTELTLFRIFDCLVDGISVLQYGNELLPDGVTTAFYVPPQPYEIPIVHFDLKPANKNRTIHPVHPLCKISDFGIAQNIPQPQSDYRDDQLWLDYYEGHRRSGTHGFYAPEQFTERWDYNGWDRLQQGVDLAGMYQATNIWGVGCIMYQLITMSKTPPDPKDPFLPQFDVRGRPPLGITYGTDLQAYPFS